MRKPASPVDRAGGFAYRFHLWQLWVLTFGVTLIVAPGVLAALDLMPNNATALAKAVFLALLIPVGMLWRAALGLTRRLRRQAQAS